ncbi:MULTISPECIES: hypothetical protein [unclassified Bifidobacterium]|uniref:variant leucine-rich repeat-containing protein n=1 Tax=unclassified Bifidobacterium TaxID=2608897 RepID=UPI0023F8AACE|nr:MULTISPECIES: hypothetical protein [unclassified Bifidobacterium]WEV65524.1 hypothetical protein OZX71_07165 [Bifidobacterium sp. ESL0764]WEV75670.1 hypothetical protein OZX75_00160 [Bifidobacterium sp. ESL0800]
MVDYDTAVAIVQDSEADPVMLAKVAYENPDFGANVAANPRAYPGLKRWLAQFGDDRARETLKSMGFEVPDQGVVAQEDPAQQATAQASMPYIADQQAASDQYAAANQYAQQPAATNQYAAQPATATGQETPVATNAYGYTAEQALDPNTDQMTIASIAQYAPELRPCLARNPNTYPELLNWLAQLHDPAIDAALATRQ